MSEFHYKALTADYTVKVGRDGLSWKAGGTEHFVAVEMIQGLGVGISTPYQHGLNMLTNYWRWKKNPNPDAFLNRETDPASFVHEAKTIGFQAAYMILSERLNAGARKIHYIPVELKDPQCIEMMRAVKADLANKYRGFGYDVYLKYALGASNNLPYFLLAVGLMVLFYLAIFLFGAKV